MSGPTIRQLANSDWGREHMMVMTVKVPVGRWSKPKNSKPKDKS